MTNDSVLSGFATKKYPLSLWFFQRRQAGRIKYFQTSISYFSQSRGEVLVLGIWRGSLSFNFCNNSSYRVRWFNQERWGKKKPEKLKSWTINSYVRVLSNLTKTPSIRAKEVRGFVQNLQLDIVQEVSAFPPLTPQFLGRREEVRGVGLFIPYILSTLLWFHFSCVLLYLVNTVLLLLNILVFGAILVCLFETTFIKFMFRIWV